MQLPEWWRRYLPLILTVLTIIGGTTASVGIFVDEDGPGPKPPKKVVEVAIDGADKDRSLDDALTIGPKGQEVVKDTEKAEGTEGNERGGTIISGDDGHPDVAPDTPKELRGKDAKPAGVLPQGGATQAFPGCYTRFVGSYSSRGGVKPQAFAVHYTAGGNLPGLADMNGLTAYSNRNQVSWHFLIDREGHCYYSVPLEAKAWTIANLNPSTINVEVIGRGTEPDYGGSAGRRKLAQVGAELRRRYGIPIALGAVSNCRVTRRGWITHWMGGGCSGGHIDIRPYSLEALIAQMRAAPSPLTKGERLIVSRNHLHRPGKGPLKWRRYWCTKNAQRRALVARVAKREGGWGSKRSKARRRGSRYQLLVKPYGRWCR